ncbi:helix-turn-helix transcriptional regulator [Bacillus haimaensis]|uniref:helix-turn-helix domain-containing protein n=1 Tax=Bacillus haimaensis TaxID=3160967 RepID=UPI003AA9A435
MIEGEIIKFYREKAKLTQGQLVSGICSITHLSKIERGLTECSPHTIAIIASRLGIKMEKEMEKLNEIKQLLDRWLEVIVKEGFQEIEVIKKELENAELIDISIYKNLYRLQTVRYVLTHNDYKKAHELIKDIQKLEVHLSTYEKNLFKHVKGLYFLSKGDYLKAINILKTITQSEYNNPEYYYHLAVSYHNINSQIMCYYYADKALHYFKNSNNFLKIIDTEMLLLVQLQFDKHHDFDNTVQQYERLIESCEMLNSIRRKSKLLHNLAFQYFIRNKYKKASELYKKSCNLKNMKSSEYLLSLEGYIRSLFEGELLSKKQLLSLTNEGINKANELNNDLYIILFNLLSYLIKGEQDQYFNYLSKKGLPYFRKYGFIYLVQRSEKELFSYYTEHGETEKALEIAMHFFMNKKEDRFGV